MKAKMVMVLQGDDLHYLVNEGWEPILAFRPNDSLEDQFVVNGTVVVLSNDSGDNLSHEAAAGIVA